MNAAQNSQQIENSQRIFIIAGLALLFLFPSLRSAYKFSPEHLRHAAALGLITSTVGFYNFFLASRSKWFVWLVRQPWPWLVGLLIASVAVNLLYPVADGLRVIMRGSDQDDCAIAVTKALLDRSFLYQPTYLGNPCSPGPGIALLYVPFVALDIYPLGMMFALALVAMAGRYAEGSWVTANSFVALFFSTILSWELAMVGSDLPMIGCAVALAALMLESALQRASLALLIGAAVVAGLAASTRVNLMYLPFLLTLFALPHHRPLALWFFACSLLVAVVPAACIYLSDPANFAPAHLLRKSQNVLSPAQLAVGALASLATALWGLQKARRDLAQIPLAVLASMAPSLMTLALADLGNRSWQLARWEGANYLMPMVPLASLLVARRISRSLHEH